MKHLLLSLLSLLFAVNVYAQKSTYIKVGTHIPQQFNVQVEQHLSQRFSVSAEGGALLKPYGKVIFGVLENFVANRAILELAGDYFEGAFIAGLKANYYMGKSRNTYVSVYGQHISLHISDQSRSFLQSHLFRSSQRPTIQMNSQFYQVGALIGRRFDISSRFGVNLEASLSKTIDTTTKLSLSSPEALPLEDFVSAEVHKALMKYGYMPTFNVMVSYRLGK